MTNDQRIRLWHLLDDVLHDNPGVENRKHLVRVLNELSSVQQRQRISGRLVRGTVTGLRMPHDALPVKVSDEEALALLAYDLNDRLLIRMLQPGPIKQGRR